MLHEQFHLNISYLREVIKNIYFRRNKFNTFAAMAENILPPFKELTHPKTGQIFMYPEHYTQEHFETALRYKPKPTDIFVCSYPKSGTTWLQNIAWLIVHGGEDFSENLAKVVPMLECDGADATESVDDSKYPRIIKCHLPFSSIPYKEQAKYLYVIRNPKDVIVSYLYHFRGSKQFNCPNLQLDHLLEIFLKGEIAFGDYFRHVSEWYEQRNRANILVLCYEDMKEDLRQNVLKVAKFLGKNYEESLLKDDEKILNEVLKKSSFSVMSCVPTKWVRMQIITLKYNETAL